ncbi:MAG TPA: energy transducer TonB, partial [Candidatus Acidoferrales bacterium]
MRIRIGGPIASANVTHMVQPVYPAAAKTAHVSGAVVLHCIIGKDGTVQQVEYVSGPPLLMKAAMDAVRQWTYKPTTLNGKVVEVDTMVKVVFQLDASASSSSAPVEVAPAVPEKPLSTDATVSAPRAPSPAPIDPQFKTDIQSLMEVTHTKVKQEEVMRKMFEPLRPQMLAGLPVTPNREKILDAYINSLVALGQSDDFTNR